jgi:hypothetical protein
MKKRIIIVFALVALFAVPSCCGIKDNEECGAWLEFVFDHNMEYSDAFDSKVATVDVYVFDRDSVFVQTRRAEIGELTGRKRMLLEEGLTFGKYLVLTVGNLEVPFSFSDQGVALVPGETSIKEVELAIDAAGASQGFEHLYFMQKPVEVEYTSKIKVYKVPLIRQTNKFHLVLHTLVESPSADTLAMGPATPKHTVEVKAPESGAYNFLNHATTRTPLAFRPHSLFANYQDTNAGVLQETVAELNTMRLLEDEDLRHGYRLTVRDIESGEEVWGKNLLPLLAATNENQNRHDGTALPLAEYLDRQGDWTIVIDYQTVPGDEGFNAITLSINGWIFRLNDIDM